MITSYGEKEEKLYEAYGFTIYGKIGHYESCITGESYDAYTTIRIQDETGVDIYSECLGNRFIADSVFKRAADCFLYWISKENPDQFLMERTIDDVLINNRGFFVENMNRRIRHEKEEEERKRIEAEREAKNEELLNLISKKCNEKNLQLIRGHLGTFYIARINSNDEQVKELISHVDKIDFVIEYAKEHPDRELTILYDSNNYEDILSEIERIKPIRRKTKNAKSNE